MYKIEFEKSNIHRNFEQLCKQILFLKNSDVSSIHVHLKEFIQYIEECNKYKMYASSFVIWWLNQIIKIKHPVSCLKVLYSFLSITKILKLIPNRTRNDLKSLIEVGCF